MPNKYYEFMERTPCVPDACHDVILAGAAKNGTALLCYCFHFGSPVVWSAQAAAAAAEAVPHNNVRGHTHKGVYVVYMGKKCLPLPPAHLGKSAIFLLRPRLCVCVFVLNPTAPFLSPDIYASVIHTRDFHPCLDFPINRKIFSDFSFADC